MVEIAAAAGNITDSEDHRMYEILTKRLIEDNRTITTMESCKSGLIACGSDCVPHQADPRFQPRARSAGYDLG